MPARLLSLRRKQGPFVGNDRHAGCKAVKRALSLSSQLVGRIQETTMKLEARIFATIAVAFFLVPALFADDTAKPADTPNKDESVNSSTAPTAAAKPEPAAKTLLSFPARSSGQSSAGGSMGR